MIFARRQTLCSTIDGKRPDKRTAVWLPRRRTRRPALSADSADASARPKPQRPGCRAARRCVGGNGRSQAQPRSQRRQAVLKRLTPNRVAVIGPITWRSNAEQKRWHHATRERIEQLDAQLAETDAGRCHQFAVVVPARRRASARVAKAQSSTSPRRRTPDGGSPDPRAARTAPAAG